MKKILLVFLVLAGCSSALQVEPEPRAASGPVTTWHREMDGDRPDREPPDHYVSIYAQNDDLIDVVDKLGSRTGISIGIDSRVPSTTVSVSLHRVHWRSALEEIARAARLKVRTVEKGRSYVLARA